MNYFNAALLPPEDLSKQIIQYAEDNFVEASNGYCLSDVVLPHVTLCQFQADHVPKLDFIFNDEINFLKPNVRKGTGRHDGFHWFELAVEKTQILSDFQDEVFSELQAQGFDVLTQTGEAYYPHLTFCRTKKTDEAFMNMPEDFLNKTNSWKFVIGKSDVNGQFLG